MARLKFFVFLVACVAVSFAGLISLSGSTASTARVQTTERLGWGQQLFETGGKLAQSLRTSAMTVAASDGALQQAAASFKDGPPSETAANAARAAATSALAKLPEAIRGASAILIGTDSGVTVIPAEGGAAEQKQKGAFSLADAVEAGALGTNAIVDGKLFRVVGAPIRILGQTGEQTAGLLGAAFPVDEAFAAQQAKELGLGVTIVAGDLVLSSLQGAERGAAAKANDGPLPGGTFGALGPVALPLFAGAAHRFEARAFPLPGIENARVVVTAEAFGLVALADFQKKALLGLGALALLGLAVMLVLGSSSAKAAPAAQAAEAQPEPAQEAQPQQAEEPAAPTPDQPLEVAPSGDSLFGDAPPPAPAVTPDDFPFGDSAPAAGPAQPAPEQFAQPEPEPAYAPAPEPEPEPAPAPAYAPAPMPASYASAAVPLPAPAGAVPMPAPFESAVGADPMADKPFDPFALAASQLPEEEQQQEHHEATVVAAVPQELLRAATRARPASAPITTPVAMPAVPLPAPTPQQDPEELHFQEVFQQFVATRAQCNEPADGLTLDKFVLKLRKNKEQLVQKYNCKSVRFQVYVKDGKAALKATPVKD